MCKYVVVDLEMCKVPYRIWKESSFIGRETIQIGAVLINEKLEITDKFMTYVSPEKGWIDHEINKLTGISNENLVDAPTFKEAMRLFIEWIPRDTKLVSWSDSDEMQIRSEIECKHIEIEGIDEILANWIDCQKTFGERLNVEKNYNLKEALCVADIPFEEIEHDGLVDAYNTALLFIKMEKEQELQLNPYYKKMIYGEDEEDRCCSSLGSLFSNLDLSGIAVA